MTGFEEGGEVYQWTTREIHWYLTENRHLLMAKSEEVLEKWIYILNWLVNSSQSYK